ncbi:MAG TPA: alcohol dehydrogenase catalytic domain-containing protein [Acidimicrobiales bacterium]|nr:alcohol dehydrogenase catalytic domain-containing protein [Acidimicrobiales bacterium]
MRAAVWDGSKIIVVDDLLVRDPGRGELQVDVRASGICHSDLNVIDGTSPRDAPMVLGHEAAGVVRALGDDVDGVSVGDAVIVGSVAPCRSCRACHDQRYTDCTTAFGRGTTPFEWRGRPVGQYANISSFSSRITVSAAQVVPAAGLAASHAALIGCAVSTGYGVVRNVAKVRAGDRVAVFGIGGIGVNVLQTCRLQRASRIIALDTDPRREGLAYRFGATDFVAVPRGADRSAAAVLVHAIEPLGVDAAIECSGAPSAIEAAIEVLDHGGVAALVGIPPHGARSSFDVGALFRGRRIVGSLNGAQNPDRDLADIVTLARDGALDLAAQVTRVWPLDEIDDAIAAVRCGDVVRAVLDHSVGGRQ